jgi:tRNA G10  N-methylase Trm11
MMVMSYLAILGRQSDFGLLELESKLGAQNISPFGVECAVLKQNVHINNLGGVQKVGRIIYQGPRGDLLTLLPFDKLPIQNGKLIFGISAYGEGAEFEPVFKTGLELKNKLKSQSTPRLIGNFKESTLTTAQIKHHDIIQKGFELLVVRYGAKMIIAITEAIQDIDWYSRRDYDRPARDAKVGMLPPKLAQIMINTTSAESVFDPFCGTGVVLQEALLMGRHAAGSDLSLEMVEATQKNLEWLETERSGLPLWTVSEADATSVTVPSVSAIISEGYLGEPRSSIPSPQQLEHLQKEIRELYQKALKNWAGQIPSGNEVTITSPVWRTGGRPQGTGIIDDLPGLGYSLRSFSHVDSRKLVYRRPDQIVGRQMLVMRKN